METNILDSILIKVTTDDLQNNPYNTIKNIRPSNDGSLQRQVTFNIAKFSLSDIVNKFFGAAGFTTSLIGTKEGLIAAAIITAALDIVSIKTFPDTYKPLIDLIKKTPRGLNINWDEVDKIKKANPDLIIDEIISAFIKDGFIMKKQDGTLQLIKRPLIHCDISIK